MATHLDLDEQEQLDQLKAVWKRYGTLIVWTLTIALAVFGGLNLWRSYQRDDAKKAAVLFNELEKSAQTGDVEKATRVFSDIKQTYQRTAYAQQSGLLAAKVQAEKGQVDAAIDSLSWVSSQAVEPEYKTVANLRLAGLLLDQKKFDEALKQLALADAPEFASLVADRRGDILMAQDKIEEAKSAYLQAWKNLDATSEYRNFVEVKLAAIGGLPAADAPSVKVVPEAAK
jgi:predicted negative regulator of RcsB-dependent stress response